jgi:hypothetical protein
MVLVMKLYSLGYNMIDSNVHMGIKAGKKYGDVAITINFTSMFKGPAFEFKIYREDTCHGTHLYDANGIPIRA